MVARTVPEALRRGLTFWRRSIQARVVVSTVLLSAVVVTGVGWLLLRQIEQGLVDHRVSSVLVEVGNENQQAGQVVAAFPGTDTDADQQATALYGSLDDSAKARGFSVVMTGPGADDQPLNQRGPEATSRQAVDSVPESLVRHFDETSGSEATRPAWTFTTISTRTGQGKVEDVPGIAVGTEVPIPADGSTRTVYYLFPLDDVQESLALVTRSLLTAGVLLLALI